jgi:type IV secretory pathway VirB2 component (pilin)
MKNLSRVILTFFVFLITGTVHANQLQTCSVATPCPDGLACVGAIGEGSGVCVMTGPQIVLCKIVDYFDKKLATVFAIFAVVMIGVAFFLGKISWGMIISVILGIGIIKGSTSIIKKVSGEDEGYCSSTVLDYSDIIGTDCVSDEDVKKNTNKVYNTTKQGDFCQDPLKCTRKTTCSSTATGTLYLVNDGKHTKEPFSAGSKVYLPEDTSTVMVTACTWSEFNDSTKTCTSTAISCTEETQTPNKDYFKCKNTCINTTFTKYYNTGEYADCKEVNSANSDGTSTPTS